MASKSVLSGLVQSREEWAARNRVLSSTLAELVADHTSNNTHRGLEIGCDAGYLTDALVAQTNLQWSGIDPKIETQVLSSGGAVLLHGWGHELPFSDTYFDCVIFANVYEHVAPGLRSATLAEIRRVLVEGGVLIGQLPNPYFPIDSHSRLPFMGYLPRKIQLLYWQLAPVSWKNTTFYVVTVKDLKRRAEESGFETLMTKNFNYPLEVIPEAVRWVAKLLERPMQIMPWAWQFVFRKRG